MQRLIEQIKRFFYWGWALRNSYDWDNGYLEEMILLKLKRMRSCFNAETYHHNRWSLKEELSSSNQIEFKQGLIEQYKADVALDICILILERRAKSGFYDRISGLDALCKTFDYSSADGYLTTLFNGQPLSKEMRDKQFALMRKTEEIKARDQKLLFSLMDKYLNCWWS